MANLVENTMKYAFDTYAAAKEGFVVFQSHILNDMYTIGNKERCGWIFEEASNGGVISVDADIPDGAKVILAFLVGNNHEENTVLYMLESSSQLWNSSYLFNANTLLSSAGNNQEKVAEYVRKYVTIEKGSTLEAWREFQSKGNVFGQNDIISPILYLKANSQGQSPVIRSVSITSTPSKDVLTRKLGYNLLLSYPDKAQGEILSAKYHAETVGAATFEDHVVLVEESRQAHNSNTIRYDGEITGIVGKRGNSFRSSCTATVINPTTDKVNYNGFEITYSLDGEGLIGNHSELVTTTENLGIPAKYIRLTLKHDKFEDNRIIPYVSFKSDLKKREKYQIGVGNGSVTAYAIPDTGVNPETLRVFTEGSEFYLFDFNLEVNQVIVNAENGVPIYASYEYGHELEEWIPLKKGQTIKYRGSALYSTDYEYAVPEAEEGKTISTVKFVLERDEGRVEHLRLGNGAGHVQLYMVDHKVKPETVKVNDAWVKAIRDAKCIEVNGRDGAELYVDYDWIADCPKMYGYYIAWNE